MANIQKISEKKAFPLKTSSLLLDTLAQLRTDIPKKGKNTLQKRAFAKYQTNEIIFPLIDLNSTLNKAYWSSFHCSNVLLQRDKTITGKYCNNRWCIVCNRIRTAKLINGYLPVIRSEISKPMFITLTIPNVPGDQLRVVIGDMVKTIRTITDLFRNRRNFKLKGIRKVECTYNDRSKDYHPHLHLLVDGYQVGQELINSWLLHYPDADKRAQDIRPADNDSLIELFKYSTKLSGKAKGNSEALDVIFKALYKKRVFQPIGLTKMSVSEDIDELQSQYVEELKSDVEVWVWEHELKDWLNGSGEFLTEYNTNNIQNNGKL